jgi:hypothetical protein
VQRELADVQRKLEQAASHVTKHEDCFFSLENVAKASDFLAQLTDGGLVRLVLTEHGRRAQVVNRAGEVLLVESLSGQQRDLVYLSVCLGLLSAASQRGIWLPLLLEDPFICLDARSTAALAVVLDDFCRRGNQVLVFTSQPAAAERLTSIGAAVHDIETLRRSALDAQAVVDKSPTLHAATARRVASGMSETQPATSKPKRKKLPPRKPRNGEASSDAA